ncbi:MAG: SDR family NAD(P)-dependent oxidoreductase [Candidatus Sumerlaeia bacterium]
MDISKSVCLVTGAAKRVGRAIALEFARRGARLIIHYRGSKSGARDTAEECQALSGKEAIALQADQQNPEAVQQLVDEAVERMGRIDVLVNSAAVFYRTPFLEMPISEWDRFMAVNVRGPMLFCRAVAPHMQAHKQGLILNICDVCGKEPWAEFVPYGVSKGALESLTMGLAKELAPCIRVNAIAPGTVLLEEDADAQEQEKRAKKESLLQRLGSPEDVARACVFLAEGSDYITGALLPIDGGKRLKKLG